MDPKISSSSSTSSLPITRIQVSYSKRTSSLAKKASELSLLSDVDIAFVSFSPTRRSSHFPQHRLTDVLNRYIDMPPSTKDYPIKDTKYYLKQFDQIKGVDENKIELVKGQTQDYEKKLTVLKRELEILQAELRIFEPDNFKTPSLIEINWEKRILEDLLKNVRQRKEMLLSPTTKESNVLTGAKLYDGTQCSFGVNLEEMSKGKGPMHEIGPNEFLHSKRNPNRASKHLYNINNIKCMDTSVPFESNSKLELDISSLQNINIKPMNSTFTPIDPNSVSKLDNSTLQMTPQVYSPCLPIQDDQTTMLGPTELMNWIFDDQINDELLDSQMVSSPLIHDPKGLLEDLVNVNGNGSDNSLGDINTLYEDNKNQENAPDHQNRMQSNHLTNLESSTDSIDDFVQEMLAKDVPWDGEIHEDPKDEIGRTKDEIGRM